LGSRTFKALPVTAAIAGTAVAAWSLLRLKLRGPPPYGHGCRAFDDDPLAPLIMTDDVRGAIADAVDAQHAMDSPDGGSRMAALSALSLPLPAVFRRVGLQQFPATGPAQDAEDRPLLGWSQPLIRHDVRLERRPAAAL